MPSAQASAQVTVATLFLHIPTLPLGMFFFGHNTWIRSSSESCPFSTQIEWHFHPQKDVLSLPQFQATPCWELCFSPEVLSPY